MNNKFPTLDESKDVSVESKGGSFNRFSFNSDLLNANWILFLLPLVWLVLMAFHNKLSIMPVVMGDVNSTLIFKMFDVMFSKLGVIWTLLRFVGMIVSVILSSVVTMFFHASWLHVGSNIVLYAICLVMFIYYGVDTNEFFKRLFLISGFVISIVWFICYFLGSIFKSMGITKLWLVEFRVSDIPVVGASVGLFGVLAYIVVISLFKLKVRSMNFVITLFLFGISFALLGSQISMYNGIVHHLTQLGATRIFTVILHFVGYMLGLIFGWQNRYRW